jgi:lysozyme
MAFPVVTSRQIKRSGVAATAAAIAIATPFLIKWEGVDYVAKQQKIDPPGIYTVCNGITNYDLPELKPGMRFTAKECADLLQKALPKYAAPIDKCLKVPVTDTMRAALYSASYNLGGGTVCKSSMMRKINQGQDQAGCDAFLKYTMANGKFLKGLKNRRMDERKLCNGDL